MPDYLDSVMAASRRPSEATTAPTRRAPVVKKTVYMEKPVAEVLARIAADRAAAAGIKTPSVQKIMVEAVDLFLASQQLPSWQELVRMHEQDDQPESWEFKDD